LALHAVVDAVEPGLLVAEDEVDGRQVFTQPDHFSSFSFLLSWKIQASSMNLEPLSDVEPER
jgi:hypothetical protein